MTAERISDEDWCAEQRKRVGEYLGRQEGLVHGEIGDWPAWHVVPYLSLWAIESIASPGSVGWWALTGDVPTDYCSAAGCRHPRLALKQIADSWLRALDGTGGDDMLINGTGLSVELAQLLRSRAETMLAYADDDEIWAD